MNPKEIQNNNRKIISTSLSIIATALLISLSIIGVTGGFEPVGNFASKLIPKFVTYTPPKTLDSYTDLNTVLANQPSISFNKNTKYVLAEVSDLDCIRCAQFHGYQANANAKSSYKKFYEEYVETGKISYSWVDSQSLGASNKKHISIYCAGEQNSSKLFEMKEKIYLAFGKTFDLNVAKTIALSIGGINISEFETCFNGTKYDSHIKQITNFSNSVLQSSGTPGFYLYKVEEKPVNGLDGKTTNQKFYTKLTIVSGNVNYEDTFKPSIQSFLNL